MRIRSIVSVLCLMLASCSGAPQTTAAVASLAPPPVPMAQVSFTIAIPQALTPKYISAGTKSATISVNGASTTVNCTATCSATVSAPIGSDTFAISLYDTAGGTGHVLSQGTLTQTIIANQLNTVDVAFNGVVATAAVSAAGATFTPGSATTTPLTVSAKDAAGNTIVGTYANAITLTDNDTTGATSFTVGTGSPASSATLTNSSATVTLNYNGSSNLPATFTITAAATSATSATLNVTTPAGACSQQHTVNGLIYGYYPCDLQDAYNINSTGGSGQTIAVVDADDYPNAEADLGVYRSAFGLPPCTIANGCFRRVSLGGVTPPVDATGGWEGEAALDLDMASAICPHCHIVLVEALSASQFDMYGAEMGAGTGIGATEISNSWGSPEYASEASQDSTFNFPGIPVVFSSGDDDYGGGVDYPAASPYVTAVGGTSLQPASNARGWSESVWNNYPTNAKNAGAQSGCSAYEPKPSWQKDTGCTNRMVADISADSDLNTGVAVYVTGPGQGGWSEFGGTSAAAPMIAAMYAVSGNASSVVGGSYPYLHASQFNDVTTGNNLGSSLVSPKTGLTALPCSGSTLYFCTAGPGYDGPTGIGTPNGLNGLAPLGLHLRPKPTDVEARIAPLAHMPRHRVCAPPTATSVTCYAIQVDMHP